MITGGETTIMMISQLLEKKKFTQIVSASHVRG
jgi:hypothetical protein